MKRSRGIKWHRSPRQAGQTAPGNLGPVQVSDESMFVIHPEHEPFNDSRVGQEEFPSKKNRLISDSEIGQSCGNAWCAAWIADGGGPAQPSRIIKAKLTPGSHWRRRFAR